jgi:hypothetical protein
MDEMPRSWLRSFVILNVQSAKLLIFTTLVLIERERKKKEKDEDVKSSFRRLLSRFAHVGPSVSPATTSESSLLSHRRPS